MPHCDNFIVYSHFVSFHIHSSCVNSGFFVVFCGALFSVDMNNNRVADVCCHDPGESSAILSYLFSTGDGADVEIVVVPPATDRNAPSVAFTAHSAVLLAASPAFRALLLTGNPRSNDMTIPSAGDAPFKRVVQRIVLNDTVGFAFSSVLSFIYTGKITLTPENAMDIYDAAYAYGITRLCSLAALYFPRCLTAENACFHLQQAVQLNHCDLVRYISSYIFKHFDDVMGTPGYLDLPLAVLQALLESDDICVAAEEKLFISVVLWGTHKLDVVYEVPSPSIFGPAVMHSGAGFEQKSAVSEYVGITNYGAARATAFSRVSDATKPDTTDAAMPKDVPIRHLVGGWSGRYFYTRKPPTPAAACRDSFVSTASNIEGFEGIHAADPFESFDWRSLPRNALQLKILLQPLFTRISFAQFNSQLLKSPIVTALVGRELIMEALFNKVDPTDATTVPEITLPEIEKRATVQYLERIGELARKADAGPSPTSSIELAPETRAAISGKFLRASTREQLEISESISVPVKRRRYSELQAHMTLSKDHRNTVRASLASTAIAGLLDEANNAFRFEERIMDTSYSLTNSGRTVRIVPMDSAGISDLGRFACAPLLPIVACGPANAKADFGSTEISAGRLSWIIALEDCGSLLCTGALVSSAVPQPDAATADDPNGFDVAICLIPAHALPQTGQVADFDVFWMATNRGTIFAKLAKGAPSGSLAPVTHGFAFGVESVLHLAVDSTDNQIGFSVSNVRPLATVDDAASKKALKSIPPSVDKEVHLPRIPHHPFSLPLDSSDPTFAAAASTSSGAFVATSHTAIDSDANQTLHGCVMTVPLTGSVANGAKMLAMQAILLVKTSTSMTATVIPPPVSRHRHDY
jgi:hypothetical protein